MGTITYLCGPPGCGKTREIRDRFLPAVRDRGADSVILLLPEAMTVAAAQDELAALTGGLYDARILTFPALARALLKISGDKEVLEVANRATQHLYIVNPIKSFEKRAKSLFSTHPPIQERVERLRSM